MFGIIIGILRLHVAVLVMLAVPIVLPFESIFQIVGDGRLGLVVRRLDFLFSITSFAVPWRWQGHGPL